MPESEPIQLPSVVQALISQNLIDYIDIFSMGNEVSRTAALNYLLTLGKYVMDCLSEEQIFFLKEKDSDKLFVVDFKSDFEGFKRNNHQDFSPPVE